MTPEEIAYAAGFFDGEDCIYRHRKDGFRVTVHQVVKTPLEWLRIRWGGTIEFERRQRPHQDIYRWVITHRKARLFLRAILPYLQVKQAKVKEFLPEEEI